MEVIDSITGFLTWYDSVQDFSDKDIVSSFKSTVYSLDPDFYDHRFKDLTAKGQDVDATILSILHEFGPIQDRFTFFHTNLTQNLSTGLTLLNQTFPDFIIDIPFHICHSLGDCDGGTRKLNGSSAMILGIDVMARIHQWNNEIPFIQHELFHIYHEQLYHPSNEPPYHEDAVYNGLWMEGLATYISYLLNPSVPYADLLLDTPPNLIADTEVHKVQIAKSLLHNLYSTNSDDYGQYFLMRSSFDFPRRCGYYIGFLLVKKLSESYSLDNLIRLTEKEFVPLFTSFLELIIQGKF